MALDVEQVAAVLVGRGVPEVVEARTEHAGHRGKGADVPAKVATVGGVEAVGAHHHRHGVPAHVGTQAFFDGDVAGTARFLIRLDRVHVAGVGRKREVHTVLAGLFQELFQQEVRALGAFLFDDGGQRLHPFPRFLGVAVRGPAAIVGVVR